MSDTTDEILFTQGMNSDDDLRVIPNTDYITGLNLISGIRENGAVVNTRGNTLIPFTLPTGRNKCIGAVRDIKRNAIIYFIWNENDNHSILHYMCTTKTIEEIFFPRIVITWSGTIPIPVNFTTSFLGFTEFNKIHSANVMDDLLLWCDGVADDSNHPRKTNIKRAKDFMNGLQPSATDTPYSPLLATSTLNVKLPFINSIKYPPLFPPTTVLGTNENISTNFIRNRMVQVSYRYVYDDNEKSRWSVASQISLPRRQENRQGLIASNVYNNYLTITVNTGHPTVKKIDVAVRFNNTSVWYQLDTPIYKYNQNNQVVIDDYINYSFDFYNDKTLFAVDVTDTDLAYDSIPVKAQTQEIIDSNRLIYANTVEGYQNPELDVELTFGNTPETIYTIIDDQVIQDGATKLLIPFIQGDLQLGTVIHLHVVNATTGVDMDVDYALVPDDLNDFCINLTLNLYYYLVNKNAISGVNNITTVTFSGKQYRQILCADWVLTDVYIRLSTQKITSFKKGANHKFGIKYKDYAGRDGGVLTDKDFTIYVKTLPEIFTGANTALDFNTAYQSFIDIFINHIPPIWAVSYDIVYAKNNLRKYVQFILKEHTGTPTAGGNIEIDATYLINYINDKLISGSIDFQFEPGDKLRFISNRDYYAQKYVEVEVLSFNVSSNIITVSFFNWEDVYGNMTTTTSEGVLVEYFAYRTTVEESEQFYFDFAQTYDIIAPGTPQRRHAGDVDGRAVNQDAAHTTPAQIRLRRGDTYEYQRLFIEAFPLTSRRVCESENFSDYYSSANFDYGRVNGVINGKTIQNGQLIRYGGRYFAATNTNNLLAFDGADFDTLQTTYGDICKVLTVGYVLKCLQTKKLTSIYINRSMIFNADGTAQVTLIDRVIGTKDPSNNDYGCSHPTSVTKDDRQMYFYDINSGSFIQDSANGQYPISNYKMNTYFKTITDNIRNATNNENIFVYCAYDNYNEVLNVTFSDENTTPTFDSQTILYGAVNNRWLPKQSYIGDFIVSNAQVIVSFKDGGLYLHNDPDAPRCNFYGVQYSSSITFVANINPETVKLYDSIAINSNKGWSSPLDTDIRILPNSGYPNGMASRLISSKFRIKEGVFYADYLRDLNTANIVNPILNGQRLRGTYMIQRIENTDTELVILFSVLVKSTYSPISG